MNRKSGVTAPVCVIIAAYNAAATIGRAVRSALDQRQVSQVVVVDDASNDGTAAAARAADDQSQRLLVITCSHNGGPSAARNRAIEVSTAPLIAILDADDFFLPDRFEPLLEIPDWDLIADNIAFISEDDAGGFNPASIAAFADHPRSIDLQAFVLGNVPRPGHGRGEMGFAKPVIRRETLTRLGARYDERLRLGEDFDLYARLLASRARFQVTRRCGYVAVERATSLSGCHATEDLRALLTSSRSISALSGLSAGERRALRLHQADLANRLHHRELIDLRRAQGRTSAIIKAVQAPTALPALARAVLRDKMIPRQARQSGGLRYLF